MTLWAWEKIRLGKRSLVWWSTAPQSICQCLYQFIIWKWLAESSIIPVFFFQGFHIGNIHSLIKTRAIKSLHSLILVQIPLKNKKLPLCLFLIQMQRTTVSFLKGNNPTTALPEDFIRFNTESSQSATASESLESWKLGLSFVYISVTQTVVNLPFPTWTYLMAFDQQCCTLKASAREMSSSS